MARNNHLQRVPVEGVPDGAFCMGVSDGFGDFLVGSRLPVGNVPRRFQHLRLELCAVNLYGNGEFLDSSGQVEVQFPPGLLIDLGVSAPDFPLGLGFGVGAGFETAGRFSALEFEAAELDSVKDKSPLPPHVAVVNLNKSGIVEIHPINIYPCRLGAKWVAPESVKLLYYAR